MKNNFDERKSSIVTKELQIEEFMRKMAIWREQFGVSFVEAMNVLFAEIPVSEQSHYLFGENRDDVKGRSFFGELAAFDTSWASVVKRFKIMSLVQEGKYDDDNSVDLNKDYWEASKQRLSSLYRLFPESKFLNNIEKVIKKYDGKIPTGSQQVGMLYDYLQHTFIWGQSLLIGNWAYWLEQKNTRQEGEDWKEVLFNKYNSPYILELLSFYLTKKIIGIYDFLKAIYVEEWKDIIKDNNFYFQGYDINSYRYFYDMYNRSLSSSGKVNGMGLNPLSAKFHGIYLDTFAYHFKKQAAQGVVYNSHQLELLHRFANLLTTHNYASYPIVEVPVQSMIVKNNMEEVFNFKVYE